jgi:uncharacterized protein CbrC (UPF0167 family)
MYRRDAMNATPFSISHRGQAARYMSKFPDQFLFIHNDYPSKGV